VIKKYLKIIDKISVSFEKYLKQVTTINMGGGHAFTENYDVDRLERIIVKFCNKFPNIKTILFEPGEAILFDCGPLVTTVLDIMHNNMDVAILDVSSSAHLVDVLEMPYRPNVRLFKTQELAGNYGEKAYTYKFGGNTCLSGDVMGDFSFNTPLEPGDVLLIEDQMHYSFVKSTFFNGVKHPDIYIKDRSNFIKVKEYKYSDFRDRLGSRL
jgi:carboxynorspermidine decarboxylase